MYVDISSQQYIENIIHNIHRIHIYILEYLMLQYMHLSTLSGWGEFVTYKNFSCKMS